MQNQVKFQSVLCFTLPRITCLGIPCTIVLFQEKSRLYTPCRDYFCKYFIYSIFTRKRGERGSSDYHRFFSQPGKYEAGILTNTLAALSVCPHKFQHIKLVFCEISVAHSRTHIVGNRISILRRDGKQEIISEVCTRQN